METSKGSHQQRSDLDLPIVRRKRSTVKARIVHALRLTVLITLAMLLPSPHGQSISERWFAGTKPEPQRDQAKPTTAELKSLSPEIDHVAAASGETEFDDNGFIEVFVRENRSLGYFTRTLPAADRVVGYRGPTEALVWTDSDLRIKKVSIGRSHDTQEHVDAVVKSPAFFDQFVGMSLNQADSRIAMQPIDGVSGATLTSLALARGLSARVGIASPNTVFSEPLRLDDAIKIFPSAIGIQGDPVATVQGSATRNSSQVSIGYLVRTGGLIEDKNGYQGPTELLIGLNSDQQIENVVIRESFDNQPYVGYLPQERSFFKAFRGKTLRELASDSKPEGVAVEGVSGATMTSVMVAEMIPRAAARIESKGGIDAWTPKTKWESRFQVLSKTWDSIRWSAGEIATIIVLITLPILLRTRWMRRRSVRAIWLVSVIVVIGWWAGNLVSLSLIAGVVTSGLSWTLAIGLACMIGVTIMVPSATKSNPYCNHLCPHGTAQQLVRPSSTSTRRRQPPRGVANVLKRLPAFLLAIAYLSLLLRPSTDVSSIEPFHAYLWQVAPWISIAFAVITIVISALIPMAYCRYGCPTGSLLDHIRFRRSAAKLTGIDYLSIGLLVIAIFVRMK